MFSLCAWHICEVYYNGASLYDHEQRSIYNKAVKDSRNKKQKRNHRPYEFHRHREAIESISHTDVKLSLESINAIASNICCSRNFVQPFPHKKIFILRKQLYQGRDWTLKRHIQLDVHHQIHINNLGNRLVTLEGIDVCPCAWYFIYGIGNSTFHRHAKDVENGAWADEHGNTRSKKTRIHTV